MAFDNMPDLGQMSLPEGPAYSEWSIARSKEAAAKFRVDFDQPYGDDPFQQLDVWAPRDQSLTDLPILVFLHGGAWRHGHKEWNGFMAETIVTLPAILVSPNYRLAPGTKYPGPLEDVIASLVWVYRNIGRYNGDKRRIFLGGHSAGAHLAALAAMRKDLMLANLLPKDVVKAVFPLSSPLDLRLELCEPGGRRERLIKNFLTSDDQDREASVVEYADKATTPMFLAWGSKDLPELLDHNKLMVERMAKNKTCVFEHHLFEGYTHFDTHMACIKPDFLWVKKVREWMTKTPALASA